MRTSESGNGTVPGEPTSKPLAERNAPLIPTTLFWVRVALFNPAALSNVDTGVPPSTPKATLATRLELALLPLRC